MKKYIRDMIDDLQRKKDKDFIPTIPPSATTPQKALPGDLENQELSKDPLERVRQLDFQAQQSELEQEGD
jgi:hypothetical protein